MQNKREFVRLSPPPTERLDPLFECATKAVGEVHQTQKVISGEREGEMPRGLGLRLVHVPPINTFQMGLEVLFTWESWHAHSHEHRQIGKIVFLAVKG